MTRLILAVVALIAVQALAAYVIVPLLNRAALPVHRVAQGR